MVKSGSLPLSRWVRATVGGSWPGCVRRGRGRKGWDSCATAGTMAGSVGAIAGEPGEDLMTDVIDRLAVAMNAHDLDAVAGLIHEDYRSEQSAHPGRAFTGRPQMLANWEAMLAVVHGGR